MEMDLDQFERERQDLFRSGPLPLFDWREAALYLRELREARPCVFDVLSSAPRLLIQPRCGVSDHEEMKALHDALAHADIATVTIDSLTRLNKWPSLAE